jgi:hypothetical protein
MSLYTNVYKDEKKEEEKKKDVIVSEYIQGGPKVR